MRSCREPIGADLNQSIISSVVIFRCSGFSLPLLVAVFIGLAIVVRWEDRSPRITHRSHEHRATLARTRCVIPLLFRLGLGLPFLALLVLLSSWLLG
jgi:hypothetical protein